MNFGSFFISALYAVPDSLLILIIKTLGAIVLPMAATWLAMQVTKLTGLVDGFEAWEKRVLVTIYGIVIAGVNHALGLTLPEAWGSLGSAEIQMVLDTGLAFLLYRVLKPKP